MHYVMHYVMRYVMHYVMHCVMRYVMHYVMHLRRRRAVAHVLRHLLVRQLLLRPGVPHSVRAEDLDKGLQPLSDIGCTASVT